MNIIFHSVEILQYWVNYIIWKNTNFWEKFFYKLKFIPIFNPINANNQIIKNFFIDNYDHPIFEGGVQLTDMIYLQKKI